MTDITASIVETMRHPVLVLDENLKVLAVNPAFRELFGISTEASAGRPVAELGDGQWNLPELLRRLEQVRDTRAEIADFRLEPDFAGIGRRAMLLNARYLEGESGPDRILVAIEDVTERERVEWELKGEREFAEKVVDASREALLILDWELRVRSANETFYDTFRVDPAETEGRLVFELGDGEWDTPRLRELLDDVLPDDIAFDDLEIAQEFPGIGHKIMLLNARRIDHLQLILLAIEDVTERRRSMEALRASEERLRRVLETDAVGLLFLDEESGTLTGANEAFLKMSGYTRGEVEGGALTWRAITPDDWVEASEAEFAKLRETGRIGPYEKEIVGKDGSRVWVLLAGRSLDDGTVVKYAIDVTDRKTAETERELLSRELSHRVKNTLAVVQSLANMTSVRTAGEYREVFLGRLNALARAHGLLLEENWRGAELSELVEQTTAAFRVDSPEMIVVEGGDVRLSAKQALGVSLILHELGTNAVKHGGLSVHGGRLTIAWWTETGDGGKRVRLTWRERGGPRVEPPGEGGFGMEMIKQTCGYELDGEARLDFAPEGLTCEITFPLE